MTSRSVLLLITVLFTATATGCGYARVFSQNAEGGVLTIYGNEKPAMENANEIMASHCGMGNYSLVSRDTVVVGQQTSTQSDTNYDEQGGSKTTKGDSHSSSETQEGKSGSVSSQEISTTRDLTEVRLTYACGG
ncbi:MAG TPA: hypothetical protein ENJ18_11000 [Nannocystis exedens]|nr:hypothetical protein [Nannocystis exedens]